MNDELEKLRPEVRKALRGLRKCVLRCEPLLDPQLATIRAELLRLQSTESRANEWQLRAERAEAELAALKARIADAPVAYLTSKTGVGPCNVASMAHGVVFDSSSYGKSVRVVLDE